MKIGITGSTGKVAGTTLKKLKTLVDPSDIVAFARNPEKAAELDLGVEVRQADYYKPEDWEPALQGIDRLVMISASEFNDREGQHANVLRAAKAAGVQHVLYTSFLHAPTSPLQITAAHKFTENLLGELGIPATIMRDPYYTQNWTGQLPIQIERGTILGSYHDGKVSPASRADLAESLAIVTAGQGHEGKIYSLSGDEGFTFAEFAAALSEQCGKKVAYVDMSEADYAAAMMKAGVPEGIAKIQASISEGASKGWLFDGSNTLSTVLGRPTKTLRQVLAEVLK
jgi:NAD(P)H dehydrogenase (quinone)